MEQVLSRGRAPPRGRPLIWVEEKGFSELVDELGVERMVGFSRRGIPASPEKVALALLEAGSAG
jgi:rRNA pseudouridine-1189 N-methylase Emg1 (Nep1/Mra1 family)